MILSGSTPHVLQQTKTLFIFAETCFIGSKQPHASLIGLIKPLFPFNSPLKIGLPIFNYLELLANNFRGHQSVCWPIACVKILPAVILCCRGGVWPEILPAMHYWSLFFWIRAIRSAPGSEPIRRCRTRNFSRPHPPLHCTLSLLKQTCQKRSWSVNDMYTKRCP